ncbi:GDP-mannose 4,6-dehydratase [Shimazuella sp. AN120528]|uniref:NAD-dependent epimerase/dehydratase family protein n=1 Tax=Shimazuella soli TaxID=1892854 RepID=UPI001F0F8A38|nr:NAD-dependent epimerase/dehydratase family protein [Shimazuella soli]MCH5583810.1 GDP-mannose 4,6-dehydratase [Shimazuella soli]
MSKILVTGCAGFIGSTLTERLLQDGLQVIGIDCFTTNYDREVKKRNLRWLIQQPRFHFLEQDLLTTDFNLILDGVDTIFHLAALPGVRTSWGADFRAYVDNNILTTQRLLESVKERTSIKKLVFSSSSSVYGGMNGPTAEDQIPRPISPYGVTKLSAEQLCGLYHKNFGVPVNSLRYFTVFGPRQRPDMAFHRMIHRILREEPIPIYGDGQQSRDFTFVEDAVTANLLAAHSSVTGEVFNIGGISHLTINEAVQLMEKQTQKKAIRNFLPAQAGDPKHTWADISKARNILGYKPTFDVEKGIFLQIEEIKQLIKQ